MVRATILAVGKLKNASLRALCADYTQRLARYGKVDVIEYKDAGSGAEAARFLDALAGRPGMRAWALAEEGETMASADLACELATRPGEEMVFLVGGPYGLDVSVKRRADRLLSLSPMTFTHEFARLLLLEQLYRAASINAGSKYHHE